MDSNILKQIWFTSDTHFDHWYMVLDRGFTNTDEHNEAIIHLWNSQVKPGDDVYHVGDFAFCANGNVHKFVSRLNGNIHLCRGNHESFGNSEGARGFRWVKDYHEMRVNEYNFVLFHYPILSWHKSRTGSIMVHGHCHHDLKHLEVKRGKTKDVLFTMKQGLISIDELIQDMNQVDIVAENLEPNVDTNQASNKLFL